MQRLALRPKIRGHLARQGRTPAFPVHPDTRAMGRDGWRWLKALGIGADNLHISVVSTVQRITEYRTIGPFGLVVLDDEHCNALGWMQSLRLGEERPIFVQTELLIRCAERCLVQQRWQEAAALCQRAHFALHRYAVRGGDLPRIDRPVAVRFFEGADGVPKVDIEAIHAIPLAAHFVLGHEIGHHVMHASGLANELRSAARSIVQARLFEAPQGGRPGTHAIIKPTAEYTMGPEGECMKEATRGIALIPALGHIGGIATEELSSDLFGLMFATRFARRRRIAPDLLLRTVVNVFQDLQMAHLLDLLVDSTPRRGNGGLIRFSFGRYAYRGAAVTVLIDGLLAGRFPLPREALHDVIEYWTEPEAQAALQQLAQVADRHMNLASQLDILARAGFMHAVMPEPPRMPPYPDVLAQLPPELRGGHLWLYAPFTVPPPMLDINEDKGEASRVASTYRGFASACKEAAAALWDPAAVFQNCGDQYLAMTQIDSLDARFKMARQARVDVVTRRSSFEDPRLFP